MQPPFPIDPPLRPEDAYRSVATLASARPEPLLTQIEELLGHDALPDTAFFVDSWTHGIAAASENFLRRRDPQTAPPAGTPAPAPPLRAFVPSFSVVTVFSVIEPAPSPDRSRASESSSRPDDRASSASFLPVDDGPALARPLTRESACTLLGVAATSTRDQIRAAYRQLASRFHPDRLTFAGARERHAATERMASLNEAYHLLCAQAL